jgi:hypothetical protein
MSVHPRTAADVDRPAVRLGGFRRRGTAPRRLTQELAAELADAIIEALPALIEAAQVVSGSGDWSCEQPIPRIGHGGEIREWEGCGACLGCRMDAAQQRLAEVEL